MEGANEVPYKFGTVLAGDGFVFRVRVFGIRNDPNGEKRDSHSRRDSGGVDAFHIFRIGVTGFADPGDAVDFAVELVSRPEGSWYDVSSCIRDLCRGLEQFWVTGKERKARVFSPMRI